MTDLTVFIIEDDPIYTEILKFHLGQLGINKIQAFSKGEDCLNCNAAPDLIILDYYLENDDNFKNGTALYREISKKFNNTDTIFTSAQTDLNKAISIMKLGALDFVTKDEDTLGKITLLIEKVMSKKLKRSDAN